MSRGLLTQSARLSAYFHVVRTPLSLDMRSKEVQTVRQITTYVVSDGVSLQAAVASTAQAGMAHARRTIHTRETQCTAHARWREQYHVRSRNSQRPGNTTTCSGDRAVRSRSKEF